ncbi:MAG: hypothetical protein ABSE89_06590 [Sedimentisphaerales bacterium]
MHPIKWIRQNQTKLMAVFVILIMIAFIMPTLLSQLAKPRSKGPTKAMWYYDTDKGISFNDIKKASDELKALRELYIDRFFISQRDLRYLLVGHLLFPESVQGAVISDELKVIVAQNQLYISPSRIDNFFEQARERPELFWILLKAEAKNAGCAISPQRAGEILTTLIPKITDNKVDAQTLVRIAGQANQMTDEMVVAAFADILTITSYARIITDTEDVTDAEMENAASRAIETIDAEFVDFDSEKFIDKTPQPDKAEISALFEKYKGDFPNVITAENPCGFGYKQRPRVTIEYMIIKLEDAKKLVSAPTEEEAEEFYQQNINHFIERVPEDVNDPNSKLIARQKSYAEVADSIRKGLLNNRAATKARKILDDAIEQSQAGLESVNIETASIEELKKKITDYTVAAEKIAKQNNIKIYAGKTALLTAEEIQQDRSLGSLIMQAQSRMPINMVRLAFSMKQLGNEAAEIGPFDPPRPKMFTSIGPFTDIAGAAVAMVRIVNFEKSSVPDLNFSYEKNLPQVFEDQEPNKKTFVLKEKVKQDCRKLAAFKIARQNADEFVELAKDKGWDEAIKKFNLLYPVRDSNEGLKAFEIQKWDRKSRIFQSDLEMIKLRAAQMPGMESLISQRIISAKLVNEFYSLFDPNGSWLELKNVPMVFEFKPQLACYVIKSLSRNPATTEDYDQTRQRLAYKENYIQTQSMTLEHFMPDNIFKRLNFRPAEKEPNKPPADANGADL